MNEVLGLTPEQEEALARYRAGAMSAAERAAFEREALASDALSEALYAEVSLDLVRPAPRPLTASAPAASRPMATVTPLPLRRSRSAARWLVPLAAGVIAVSALVLLRPRPSVTPGADVLRGVASLSALEPVGNVTATPERFRWTSVPGATSYRVELFDLSGNSMGTAVSRDTTIGFGAVARAPLAAGEWRVTAIGPDGIDRDSRTRAAFRVIAP
jgi:hypothetical protein